MVEMRINRRGVQLLKFEQREIKWQRRSVRNGATINNRNTFLNVPSDCTDVYRCADNKGDRAMPSDTCMALQHWEVVVQQVVVPQVYCEQVATGAAKDGDACWRRQSRTTDRRHQTNAQVWLCAGFYPAFLRFWRFPFFFLVHWWNILNTWVCFLVVFFFLRINSLKIRGSTAAWSTAQKTLKGDG